MILLLIFVGCNKVTETSGNIRFEVYLSSINGLDGEYIMEETPLFTNKDLKSVNWSNQEYIFTDDFMSTLNISSTEASKFIEGSILFDVNPLDKFNIYIDGVYVYEGFFEQSAFSSFYAVGAIIKDLENGITIDFINVEIFETKDKRFDDKIKRALTDLGLIN